MNLTARKIPSANSTGAPYVIATIRLPVRVPFGVHGGWAPDRVIAVE